MKNETLFNKTIRILVKAYQNDMIEHGNYCSCAVGNLIVDALNIKTYREKGETSEIKWEGADGRLWYNQISEELIPSKESEAYLQIISTGYDFESIVLIESAFEKVKHGSARHSKTKEELLYDGLMSVVDTLMLIHGATTKETKAAKELFVKA